MGGEASHTENIHATTGACLDALLDFESYPQWQSAVKTVDVRERFDDGGALVAFEVDATIKRVKYALRYHLDGQRLWWDYAGGDLASIEGDYTFADRGDGSVDATYRVGIDLGRFVPSPVKRVLTGGVMKRSVQELKARVEGRS